MGRGGEIIVSDVITVFMVYLFYSFVYFIFPRTLFFREILGLQQNWEGGTEISHIPLPEISSPWSILPTHFLPRMNFTLTHNNHPYSIMYLRAHSWWILVHSVVLYKCVHCDVLCLVTRACLSLCNSMDCSSPGSSVHGLLQARTLEWVATVSSRDLPKTVIKPRSPALQADSLLSEPQGSPRILG